MYCIRRRYSMLAIGLAVLAAMVLSGCDSGQQTSETVAPKKSADKPQPVDPRREALREQATELFGPLEKPVIVDGDAARVHLGRILFYDSRLSQEQDISCNSCHNLTNFGVDNEPTSAGHQGTPGKRNTPTVYNSHLNIAQSWDGKSADLAEQAGRHILNPLEMAVTSEGTLVTMLASIPGYPELFTAAFPEEKPALTFSNLTQALASFESGLVTPDRFDAFMQGDLQALNEPEVNGLELFIQTGCAGCHSGPALGGGMYTRTGMVKDYPTEDKGRLEVTGDKADEGAFKVPGLRNVARTGPYFHDGSVTRLVDAIRLMADHQLDKTLSDADLALIAMFLESLTGTIDMEYIAKPQLPGEKAAIGPAGKS